MRTCVAKVGFWLTIFRELRLRQIFLLLKKETTNLGPTQKIPRFNTTSTYVCTT